MMIQSPDPEAEPEQLTGYLEEEDDGEDMYTVAPEGATGDELMSSWITVPASLVEDLDEMR
jgi:hypothetical protein